jgi:hypothetical protein
MSWHPPSILLLEREVDRAADCPRCADIDIRHKGVGNTATREPADIVFIEQIVDVQLQICLVVET